MVSDGDLRDSSLGRVDELSQGTRTTLTPIRPTSERWAAIAFGLYIAASWVFILRGPGAERWFFVDEWAFLAERDPGDLASWLAPHGGHWVTIPYAIYRGLFAAFGLTSYVPYLVANLVAHTMVVILLRSIMRRSGVAPWTATIVASVLTLFGPGSDGILSAFQIAFTAAVAFGLGSLVAADFSGRSWRRDIPAVALGVAAVMCSAIGLVLVIAVALFVAVRRGWWAALAYGAVPVGVFLVWWIAEGAGGTGIPVRSSLWEWLVAAMLSATVALAGAPVLAVALVMVVIAGIATALATRSTALRTDWAAPLSLAAGWLLLVLTLWWTRSWQGPEGIAVPRYTYVSGALLLPLTASALNELAGRWRAALALLVLPLTATALNASDMGNKPPFNTGQVAADRDLMVAIGNSPQIQDLPAELKPIPGWGNVAITLGWLRAVAGDGKLPATPLREVSPEQVRLSVGLLQVKDSAPRPPLCRSAQTVRLAPRPGDRFWFDTPTRTTAMIDLTSVVVSSVDGAGQVLAQRAFLRSEGSWLEALTPGFRLTVTSPGGAPVTVCRTGAGP